MKPRILKKHHTRYLAEFLVECSQNEEWKKKLQSLSGEDKLDTALEGMPAEFVEDFPEVEALNLQYCVERVEYEEVPRAASSWWPVDDETHYYVAYPAQFPESEIYLAIDFDDHSECCH
ncbi:MAG: hypothetical protein VW258_04335 [Thalassolituus sp.]